MLTPAIITLAVLASASPVLSAPFASLLFETAAGTLPLLDGNGLAVHTTSSTAPAPTPTSTIDPAVQSVITEFKLGNTGVFAGRDDAGAGSEAFSLSKLGKIGKIGLNIGSIIGDLFPSSSSPPPPPPPPAAAAPVASAPATVQQRELLELLTRSQRIARDTGSGTLTLLQQVDGQGPARIIASNLPTSSSTSAPAPTHTPFRLASVFKGFPPALELFPETVGTVQARELLEILARADDSDDESGASILSSIKSLASDTKKLEKVSSITGIISDGVNVITSLTGNNQQQPAAPPPAPPAPAAPQPSAVQQRDLDLSKVTNFESSKLRPFLQDPKALALRAGADPEESGASILSFLGQLVGTILRKDLEEQVARSLSELD